MSRDAPDPAADAAPFMLGRWRIDPATDTIEFDGRVHKLEPRTMRLLIVLASRPGEVIAGRALIDAVWPGVIVTDQSLYQAVGELRAALKADARTGGFIATVPRRGYRLVAPVVRPGAPSAADPSAPERPERVERALRTIAVLPFRDLGVGPERAFLKETLLAGLIHELSRQPDLSPIARGTMLSYLDQPTAPRRVAHELGVRYVLDGTISQVGDTLRIGCELVDASSGAVLAAEAVELAVARWPDLTQRVVGRLARAARLHSSVHAAKATAAVPVEDLSALELAMRAWVELYGRPQARETNDRAWAWASEALRRDGTLGPAWNALAYCEWRAAQYAWSDRDWATLLSDAVEHAERATSLAPEDPDACYTLGLATYTRRELFRAEAILRHCIEISGSYAPAHGLLGLVRAVRGHPEETAELCDRAFALSPREPLRAAWHWSASCAASMLGRDEAALEHASLGIAANPDYPPCYLVAAVSSRRLGLLDEAARHATVLRRTAFDSVARLRLMLPPMAVEPWASAFLSDLHASGLPER